MRRIIIVRPNVHEDIVLTMNYFVSTCLFKDRNTMFNFIFEDFVDNFKE